MTADIGAPNRPDSPFDTLGAIREMIDRTQRRLAAFDATGGPVLPKPEQVAALIQGPTNLASGIRVVGTAGQRGLADGEHAVRTARTVEEFGAALKALRLERGLSLDQLKDQMDKAGHWVAKSTLSRACNGQFLFRECDHVKGFVTACGERREVGVWVQAWSRVRRLRDQKPRRPSVRDAGASAEKMATVFSLHDDHAGGGDGRQVDLDGPGDEVLGEIRIQFTRDHVRMAIALLAVLGLAATTADTPKMQTIGAVALTVAVSIALVEQGFPKKLPPALAG